ncbi:hypothetical protein CMI47_00945 [Candidatus Pacearchaeota archaeon]|nr:hypothetical protein [Candidatus Pacearchaeota archaeon]
MGHLPGGAGFSLSRREQFRIEVGDKPCVELPSNPATSPLVFGGVRRVVIVDAERGDSVVEAVIAHKLSLSLTWRVGD